MFPHRATLGCACSLLTCPPLSAPHVCGMWWFSGMLPRAAVRSPCLCGMWWFGADMGRVVASPVCVASQARHGVVECVYESSPQVADHKVRTLISYP